MRVYIQVIRKIIQGAAARGASYPALCKAIGLTPEELNENDRFYEGTDPVIALWQLAERSTGDPLLGLHIGEEIGTSIAGLVGYLMNSCPTMKAALQAFVSHQDQVTEWMRQEVRVTDDEVIFSTWIDPELKWLPTNVLRHVLLMGIAGYARVPGLLIGMPVVPLRVELAHVDPGHLEECRRVLRCPVVPSMDRSHLHFRLSDMEQPLLSYDRSLHKMFSDMVMQREQAAKRQQRFSDRVRSVLISEFGGRIPGITVISGQMNVSARTFQRKLEEENISYRAIGQEVRKEFAIDLLKNSAYTIDHIADILGFSDASTFIGAFKQWTGMTPGSVRRSREATASS